MHDPTFKYRLAGGLSILAALALWDLIRHPKNPTRVKEYAFLFGVTAAAMAYGVAHDFVTHAISPAYYVLGKGIDSAAGGFNRDIVKLAMKATWSVGLIGGAAYLLANNPGRHPQLGYGRLARLALLPLICSAGLEALLGAGVSLSPGRAASLLGTEELLAFAGPRFLIVWAMHWGAYGGGALGIVAGVVLIRRRRHLAVTRPESK